MSLWSNLYEVTASRLQALIDARTQESQHLEYKRELPSSSNADKTELCADVSAFANSGGGDILFGMAEDDEGCAVCVTALAGSSDQESLRIQSILTDNVEPRLPGLQVVPVALDGGFALVVRVPQSWAGPHRVRINNKFYVRDGGRKRPLDVPEIRGLFLRTEQQAEKIRNFRTERLSKLLCGEGPRLKPGPILAVHLIPTQSALGLVQVDPVQYASSRCLPSIGSMIPGARMTLDGALGLDDYRSEGADRYSLMFRSGFFEAVAVIGHGGGSTLANLASTWHEDAIIKLLEQLRAEYEAHNVGTEMVCMLSLIGADEVKLGVSQECWVRDHQGVFDRKVLALPDVLIRADVSAATGLKPVFDLLWQSAGFLGSFNYDENGDRRVP